MSFKPVIPVLIVEDDDSDAFLARRALETTGFPTRCHICRDGEEAMLYLSGSGIFSDRQQFPFPRILITDIKMPRADGLQLLAWLKDRHFSIIPSIVLSGSKEPRDIQRAYELGANSYVVKPSSYNELVSRFQIMLDYWKVCELPDCDEKPGAERSPLC